MHELKIEMDQQQKQRRVLIGWKKLKQKCCFASGSETEKRKKKDQLEPRRKARKTETANKHMREL